MIMPLRQRMFVAVSAILMAAIVNLSSQVREPLPDSILTVTQARIDANGDHIPDLLGRRITVAGRANVYSGVIHTDRLVVFLEDEKSGIGLYGTEFGTPIAEGDSVVAVGVVEQFEGMTRIRLSTYRTLIVSRPMGTPPVLHARRLNSEAFEGRLVRFEGEIRGTSQDAYGSYLHLQERRSDNDSVVVFLFHRHKPGIHFDALSIGDRIIVTGVLGQFARGSSLDSGYEIFPRYPEDIVKIETPTRNYLIAVYIFGGTLVVVLLWVVLLRGEVRRRTRQLRESEDRFRSVFEGARDILLVLSDDLTIENANPAACQLTGLMQDEIKGRPLRSLFEVDTLQMPASGMEGGDKAKVYEFETSLKKENAEGIRLLAKMNVFKIGTSQRVVLVLRDITERKKAEQEREELINKLTDALAEVRALSGLLPICAHCKKIRDDKGYWKQLEEYFHTHSDVRFSHGLCPDCVKKLYPMIANKKR